MGTHYKGVLIVFKTENKHNPRMRTVKSTNESYEKIKCFYNCCQNIVYNTNS